MPKIIEIQKGEIYWNLTIIKEIFSKKRRYFICKCICWKQTEVALYNLRCWTVKSCWCIRNIKAWNRLKQQSKAHWLSRSNKWKTTKFYIKYNNLQQRCNNKNHKRYKDWGWRWIKCEFVNIIDFIKSEYLNYCKAQIKFYKFVRNNNKWLHIDRENNNWNYCKWNIRWVTPKINSLNRRNNL